MSALGRYCTAFNRYKRSKGFGIHSPFAFHFVLRVLCEPAAYYAYASIDEKRRVAARCRRSLPRGNRRGVISRKSARMLFRIVNHFNPRKILQFGTSYGVSASCALAVGSQSRLWLCERRFAEASVGVVLDDVKQRICVSSNAADAISAYEAAIAGDGERRFVVVNDIEPAELPAVENWLKAALAEEGSVVVARNIDKDPQLRGLWKAAVASMASGMSFSNGKIGIAVASPKLPLQHFNLWF